MKVYVAAPWVRRSEARDVRDRLVKAGHKVTSRWLDTQSNNSVESLQSEATNDLQDIRTADALVVLNLSTSEGKAVETGYALAMDLPIFVVGGVSNVFHWLPQIRHVHNIDTLLDLLV